MHVSRNYKALKSFMPYGKTTQKQNNLSSATNAYNAPINSKLQHPPRAFELLKIGLFKFPPLGAKKPFKCPTNWY